ncbi:MAG: hypothetical protein HC924_03185 [Synechococcaceae cyanobacterium SM2_3_2]|nr:hypothetical protein [Synechococcaceae cyanobacterium SM2_3_2]
MKRLWIGILMISSSLLGSPGTAQPLSPQAEVIAVEISGDPLAYQFAVTIESPDTGCDQYANWWEVLTPEGELLYRRILFHSHVDEQPFTRSGGAVALSPEQEVIVRAHLDPDGYGTQAMQGTVAEGFETVELPLDFAVDLASQDPVHPGCAF